MSWSLDKYQVRTDFSPVNLRESYFARRNIVNENEKFPKNFLGIKTMQAIVDFSNAEMCVRLPIVKGKCPDIRELEASQHPPGKLDYNDVPARFTVEVGSKSKIVLEFMVELTADMNNMASVIGFISHTQTDKLRKVTHRLSRVMPADFNFDHFVVGARYSRVLAEGHVFVYKDFYELLVRSKEVLK